MKLALLTTPGGPDALQIVERHPPNPAPGEVVVCAEAIGLGRPDVMMRTGKYKWMPPLPGVIGNELAGRVVKLGSGTDASWLGRRVLVSSRELEVRGGCYAEEMAVPADALIELPDSIDPLFAVCLPNYQLAWGLLHDATRGRRPTSIYLNGAAGGVGMAMLDTCRLLGLVSVAGASTEAKRGFALGRGAVAAIDSTLEPKQLGQAVLDATGGQGVDAAYDHAGGVSFNAHLDMLRPFGMLVSYNALSGPAIGDPYAELRSRASKAIAVAAYNMHAYNGHRMRDARRALLRQAIEWMAAGQLKPSVQTFSLERVREAHTRLDRADFTGKLALVP